MEVEHMEHSAAEKKNLSPAEAEAFVLEAAYEIGDRPVLSCCVDGRYDGADAEAAPLARAGADAGDMLIAIAALRRLQAENKLALEDNFLRQSSIQAAIRAAGGAKNFRLHTDDHHLRGGSSDDVLPESLTARGCGHLGQAEKDPAAYGLSAEDVKAVFGALTNLKEEGAEEVVLSGGHGEGAVFVVKAKSLGLRHAVNGRQAFVFHEARHDERLDLLAEELLSLPQLRETGLSAEELTGAMRQSSGDQTMETLRRLAKGLPIYEVSEEGGKPRAQSAGQV